MDSIFVAKRWDIDSALIAYEEHVYVQADDGRAQHIGIKLVSHTNLNDRPLLA